MKCVFCDCALDQVMDFGEVALAGGFLKAEAFAAEKKYPLRLGWCHYCSAVQLIDRLDPDVMFRDYFYFSSATESVRKHAREYAAEVVKRFQPLSAIEIGCNDGVMLEPLRQAGVSVFGVDPSSTVPKGPDIVNEYFTEEVAANIGPVDLVIANNVFAHVRDIHGLTQAIARALKPGGVFVMEVHYLGDMVGDLQYDWIYHEHLYYYSLKVLEEHFARHGMVVFDVKKVNMHGGSMRYYVCRNGQRSESEDVQRLRMYETLLCLDRKKTYTDFADRIKHHGEQLRGLMSRHSGRIAGYGAGGRANALIQYTGIKLDYIVDDAPAKQGYFTPGSHIPIRPREELENSPPASVMVFPAGYVDEIRAKCGNLRVIVPLPNVRVLHPQKLAA